MENTSSHRFSIPIITLFIGLSLGAWAHSLLFEHRLTRVEERQEMVIEKLSSMSRTLDNVKENQTGMILDLKAIRK